MTPQQVTFEDSKIIVSDLHFSYIQSDGSKIPALNGVDCEFHTGHTYTLLGRNGSGKSTLARCLNGILQPERGSIEVMGQMTTDPESLKDIHFQVGMVFQDPENQMVANTVEEEVAFGPENLGLDPPEIRERVDWAIALVGLSGKEKVDPHALSQGQKQLVALAGALALRPRFLVSDESTSMLDWPSRQRVMRLFLRLREEQSMGIIHITHFVEEALDADQVLVLEDGLISATGIPREILSSTTRVKGMGLSPPVAAQVSEGLRGLGWDPPDGMTRVEELISWLRI